MVLQVDPTRSGSRGIRGRRRWLRYADLVVDQHAVMQDGHKRAGFLAAVIDAAGVECDVIRLPLRRRRTHSAAYNGFTFVLCLVSYEQYDSLVTVKAGENGQFPVPIPGLWREI